MDLEHKRVDADLEDQRLLRKGGARRLGDHLRGRREPSGGGELREAHQCVGRLGERIQAGAHEGAATDLRLDDPFLDEPSECPTDGCSAHVKLFTEASLRRKPVSRAKSAGADRVRDRGVHLLVQRVGRR